MGELEPPTDPQEISSSESLPIVTIIGRPNVGKSTLFNRLLGKRKAVITSIPGTTRDRLEGICTWNGVAFTLVDTAGLEGEAIEELEEDVAAQIKIAREKADLILFLVDIRGGITGSDATTAKELQKVDVPVILVANKADSAPLRESALQETQRLGIGDPVLTSSASGSGTGDLLDAVVQALDAPEATEAPDTIQIGLFGRPNVGKSTLLNNLIGEERSIVSDVPGTTRDTIDVLLETRNGPITIVDTAGIRRKSKIKDGSIDLWVTRESLKTLERCDVAMLLIDAAEPITAQDRRLAKRALTDGVGLIVVVNKWDLIRKQKTEDDGDTVFEKFQLNVRRSFPFLRDIPIVTISAESGRGTDQLLPMVHQVQENRERRIDKEVLEEVMKRVRGKHGVPTNEAGKDINIMSLRQADGVPPLFLAKVERMKDGIPRPYVHLIEREIRETADFVGVTVKVRQIF